MKRAEKIIEGAQWEFQRLNRTQTEINRTWWQVEIQMVASRKSEEEESDWGRRFGTVQGGGNGYTIELLMR